MKRRKLGVHFVIDIEGEVIQHADPVIDAVPHAGSTHNPVSIGIEIVNPYYPRYKTSDWPLVIDAKWAHEKKYVVATLHQVEALYRLLLFLTDKNQDLGLDIPLIFHGFDSKKNEFCMNRISWAKFMRKPGIYAHTAFAHADGAFPMLYCIIRTQTGLSPDVSYKRALILATMASSTTARLGD